MLPAEPFRRVDMRLLFAQKMMKVAPFTVQLPKGVRGGGVTPYTGKLRPKGVPFSGFRPCRYVKEPLIIIFRVGYGCISLFIST